MKSNQSKNIHTRFSPLLTVASVSALLIGGGLMYLFDPQAGNRRRAIARDRTRKLVRKTSHRSLQLFRHSRNRASGVLSLLVRNLISTGGVSDRKVLGRIKSSLGRSIKQPHAVAVVVKNGAVMLRGYLDRHEISKVVQAVQEIPGVRAIENQIIDKSQEVTSAHQH